MFIFINPWASYDPEDIPSLLSGDPEIDKDVIWAFLYSIFISFVYAVGLMSVAEYVIGFGSDDFPTKFLLCYFIATTIYVSALIFGIKKIMER